MPFAPITLTLHLEKSTKGTYRFQAAERGAGIETLYIDKTAFAAGEPPAKIRLTVAAAE